MFSSMLFRLIITVSFLSMLSSTISCEIVENFVCDSDKSIIYCPWRDSYEAMHPAEKKDEPQTEICPFCFQLSSGNDEKYFILRRFKHHVLMMNAFPMAKGHLLIIPYDHEAFLSELSCEARQELIEIVAAVVETTKEAMGVQGVNVGFNLGPNSGASIPGHLHTHIVPRNGKHMGFYEIIGKMQMVMWDMHTLYEKLKKDFSTLSFQ